jgi:hypothetical protein
MKNIFQAVSKFFDDAFFEAPRYQLNQAEKNLMVENGYKVNRAMAPYSTAYLSIHIPMLEYDLVMHASGENLSAEEYKTVEKIIDGYRNTQQNNGSDLTNNAPK